jgi:serine/threonine-protein kinase
MQLGKTIEVPSRRYGKYIVRSRLGTGGMAEVFLAEAIDETGHQLNIALKLMRKGISEEQFADEADLMGLLSHPNLVRMMEHGTAFGRLYIAMEFLIGGDLKEVMDSHRRQMRGFPLDIGVYVMIEVLKALAYFHQATTRTGSKLNLVHSDVTPANVFFSGTGEVKLGDYGVASSTHVDIGPGEGMTAGKIGYLSPEQTRCEPLSPSSDLWAVGVMLYELVVGFHPFQSETTPEQEIILAIRSPRLSIPDYVDKPMAAILSKALAPDLRSRYRSAGEFAGQLFQYSLDRNISVAPRQVQEWLQSLLGILM